MQKEPLCTEKGCPCPMSMRTIGSMFAEIKVGTLQRSREHLAKATRRLVMNNSDSAAKPTELSDEQAKKIVGEPSTPLTVGSWTRAEWEAAKARVFALRVRYNPDSLYSIYKDIAINLQAEVSRLKLPQPVQPAPIEAKTTLGTCYKSSIPHVSCEHHSWHPLPQPVQPAPIEAKNRLRPLLSHDDESGSCSELGKTDTIKLLLEYRAKHSGCKKFTPSKAYSGELGADEIDTRCDICKACDLLLERERC